jgi:dihydrofolate reductase
MQMEAEGDAFFPYFDKTEWLEVSREKHCQIKPNYLEYHFITYLRKK